MSWVLISIFLGAIASLGIVYAMKWNRKIVVWGLFITVGVCLLALTIFLYVKGFTSTKDIEKNELKIDLTALK